ncbi:MAG: hypothetical protein GTN99_06435 [Candidatus Dadabacteria bacterium]|nr:hypothetical protein [Candidatus Dadabacteria bacterium]NIT13872.1 hypothetical protein [Candidatus Dadabacteria bacterium]
MSNENHLELLKMGVEQWNEWREQNPEVIPDFSWANLPGMDFKNYNFENANLKLAFCKNCDFSGANLKNSNLYGANLEHANCTGSDFQGANLEGALFKDAVLVDANLSQCNFRLANMEGSDLRGADLTGCKKLKADQLSRASTLYRAKLSDRIFEGLKEKSIHLFKKI